MKGGRGMILFGAGASYGSESPGVRVPPPCAGLYDVWSSLLLVMVFRTLRVLEGGW